VIEELAEARECGGVVGIDTEIAACREERVGRRFGAQAGERVRRSRANA
jgi:hypothetical protein